MPVKNVLLITIDSWRSDFFQTGDGTDSFLSSLAQDGVTFDNAIATGSGTPISFPGILLGVLPLEEGYFGVTPEHDPLASVLSNAGIVTSGVSNNVYISRSYGYETGFDQFRDHTTPYSRMKKSVFDKLRGIPVVHQVGKSILNHGRVVAGLDQVENNSSDAGAPYKRADEQTTIVLDLLDDMRVNNPNKQMFSWVHYMEPHRPYFPPEDCLSEFGIDDETVQEINRTVRQWEKERPPVDDPDRNKYFEEETIEKLIDIYKSEIKFVDQQISRLVEGLKTRGILSETVLICCADHGDEFQDHGDFGHRPRMYDELIKVPLFIRDWTEEIASESHHIEDIVSLADIPPTITDAMGVDKPDSWSGYPLQQLIDGDGTFSREFTFSELCHKDAIGNRIQMNQLVLSVSSQNWKYIHNRQTGIDKLFNLDEDPGERHNVISEHQTVSEEFRSRIDERIDRIKPRDGDEPNSSISSDTQERLRELGYVEE